MARATIVQFENNGEGKADERLIHEAVGHAIIATDLDGAITYWNPAAETIYGWRAADVIGKPILDVTPTNQSRAQAAAIFETLLKGETWSGEFDVRDRNGRWFPVQVTDTPVRNESGKIIAIVGTSVRLSERAQAAKPAEGKQSVETTFTGRERLLAAMTPNLHVGPFRSTLYAIAFLGAGVLARFALDTVIPGRLPYITFFPSVLFTVFFCDFSVALVALIASAAIGTIWLDAMPSEALSFRLWGFVLFTLFGGANAAIVVYLKEVLTRLRERDRQLALINQELKHRMRNLFAVTSSICSRTAKYATSIQDTVSGIQGRIAAVASAQDLLGIGARKTSDLRALVDAVVRPLSPSPSRLTVEGPDTSVAENDTLQFALVLHELSTNALKYGAWHEDTGHVAIHWQRVGSELHFSWHETVTLKAPPVARAGFGSDLIKRAFMGGLVEYNLAIDGLKCRIAIPLPASAKAA